MRQSKLKLIRLAKCSKRVMALSLEEAGAKTKEYLDYILNRLTFWFNLPCCNLCFPTILTGGQTRFGGTSMLILFLLQLGSNEYSVISFSDLSAVIQV